MLTEKEIRQVEEVLNKQGINGEVSNTFENETSVYDFSIEIEWGDWKHDHLCADHLMRTLGYKCIEEDETQTDGSDCYSSVHYYKKMNETDKKIFELIMQDIFL